MVSIQKLLFVLFATIAYSYAAAIAPNFQDTQLQTLYYANDDANLVDVKQYDPSNALVSNPENEFEVGKFLAEISKTMVDYFSKMQLSEDNLKNIIQMLVPLMNRYFGDYSQVLVPIISGIATAFVKSLMR